MTLKEYLSNIIEWHALDIDGSLGKENLKKYSLDKQVSFIKDKYETYPMTYDKERHYVDDDGENQVDITMSECVYIKLPNVRIRSRKYVQMGSYYLRIELPEEKHDMTVPPLWTIHSRYLDLEEGDIELVNGWHPHIDTNAKPCQGSHGAMIATAFKNCNFVMAIQLIKKFLNSYYGRSVYHPIRQYIEPFYGSIYDTKHHQDAYEKHMDYYSYKDHSYDYRHEKDPIFYDKYVDECGGKELFEKTLLVPSIQRNNNITTTVEGQDVKRLYKLGRESLKLERWEVQNSPINPWCWYIMKQQGCTMLDAFKHMLLVLHYFRMETKESLDIDQEMLTDIDNVVNNGAYVISFNGDDKGYGTRRLLSQKIGQTKFDLIKNVRNSMGKTNMNLWFPALLSPGMNQYWEGVMIQPETGKEIAKHVFGNHVETFNKGFKAIEEIKELAYDNYLKMLNKEIRRIENVTGNKVDDNSGVIQQVALFS